MLRAEDGLRTRIAALIFACTLLPQTAFGAPSNEVKVEARERFTRGVKLYDERDYPAALAEFQKAYDLAPHPTVLFNVAQVQVALGRIVEARRSLDRLLASPEATPSLSEKARALRDQLLPKIAQVTVKSSVAGARVEVDGVEVGVAPLAGPVDVASGTRVVAVYAAGFQPARKEILVAGKTTTDLSFDLEPLVGKLAHLRVKSGLPGARIYANDQLLGESPAPATFSLLPGKYRIELRRDGYRTAAREISLGEGADGEVELDPEESGVGPRAEMVLGFSETSPVVVVDGHPASTPNRLSLPVGPHHLHVERAGFYEIDRDVVLEQGQPLSLQLQFSPTPETRAAHAEAVSKRKTLSYTVLGSGAVLFGAGMVYGLVNLSSIKKSQDTLDAVYFDSEPGSGRRCDPRSGGAGHTSTEVCQAELTNADADVSNAKTRGLVSWVVAGVGAAAAVTGVVLLTTGPDPNRFGAATVAVTRVTPWVGLGTYGLGLSGSF